MNLSDILYIKQSRLRMVWVLISMLLALFLGLTIFQMQDASGPNPVSSSQNKSV